MLDGFILALQIAGFALMIYVLFWRRPRRGGPTGRWQFVDRTMPDPKGFFDPDLRPTQADEAPDPADGPAPRPYEQEIIDRRAREGRRIRLAGAVYGGALQRDGLEQVIIEGDHRGAQGKAIRILATFFTPAEASPVLTRALARHGPAFADFARSQILQAGEHASFRAAFEAATAEDEGWLLALLPFVPGATQRAIGEALVAVGTADGLATLRALPANTRPPPWLRETIEALRARLAAERAGGLALAPSTDRAGGLSPAPQPSAHASDSPR